MAAGGGALIARKLSSASSSARRTAEIALGGAIGACVALILLAALVSPALGTLVWFGWPVVALGVVGSAILCPLTIRSVERREAARATTASQGTVTPPDAP
jgi:hypothetical protein